VLRTATSPLRRALVAAATTVAPLAYRKARLGWGLTRHCRSELALPDASVTLTAYQHSPGDPHLVMLGREQNRFRAACFERMILNKPNEVHARLTAALTLFASVRLDPFQMVADLSDGEGSGPGLVSFCSRDRGAILVPDHQFLRSRGYAHYRQFARANQTAWRARSDRIIWRGTSTGHGRIATDELSADDPGLRLRVRLCLRLREVPATDAKISAIAQSNDARGDAERLGRAGIMGEYISPLAWHGCKFAIDVDGNSNAWSNLFTRLITGCCVLKVASPLNYRQWYYDALEPWTHYVPVKADLSDLVEQIAWCRANADACERIAANGQALATTLSYETEVASAIERISSAFKEGRLRTSL
jgi:hypothetical protein